MNTVPKRQSAYLYMLCSSFSFATMGALSRLAGEHYPWQFIAIIRTAGAFLITFIIVCSINAEFKFLKPRMLWLRSLSGSLGIVTLFYALPRLPLSDTLTLINTSPLWVTILSWIVYKQKPKLSVLMAVSLGFIGVLFIQQPHFQGEKIACLMALLNGLFTAVSMLGLNKLKNVNPWSIVLHFSGVSTVIVLLLMLFNNVQVSIGAVIEPSFAYLLGISIMGMTGQFFMTQAFSKGIATKVSIITLSQIIFGLLLDLLFWGKQISVISLIGMVLVIIPTAWLLLHDHYLWMLMDESKDDLKN